MTDGGYSRVVVPLDGSERARRALAPARELGVRFGASLGVVTVVEADEPDRVATGVLDAAAVDLEGGEGDAIVLRDDDVAGALARLDGDHPDWLLCLSTRGRGPLTRAVLGSVASEVVRRSDQAVALVGPACDARPGSGADARSFVVGLDGSEAAEVVLAWVRRWSEASGLDVVLLHVVYPLPPPAAGVVPSAERVDELGYLAGVRSRLERDGCRVLALVDQHTEPARAVLETAEVHRPLFLAGAGRGRGPAGEWLLGSTMGEIVRRAREPVLVVSRGP